MKYSKIGILLSLITLILSGCVTYQDGRLPNLSSSTPFYDAEMPITYTVTQSNRTHAIDGYEKKIAQHLKNSGFNASKRVQANEDIPHLEVQVEFITPSPLGPIISGITLTTIPTWASAAIKVTATLHTTDEQQLNYEFKESFTQVTWFPLVFAVPFNKPFSIIGKVEDTVFSNLANSVSEDISYN